MKTFKLFSKFFGLKHNVLKCEFADIGSLKEVKIAVCGIKRIDLTIIILAIHFSHNQKLQIQHKENSWKASLICKIIKIYGETEILHCRGE